MKATATAHPIQGLVKYHGIRDPELRTPYHDSISLCTAPSNSTTTVAFESDRASDHFVIDGEVVEGRAAERIQTVVDHVRERADIESAVRVESENSFPTNVGFGSSSSGFAALAMALVEAAGLDLSRPDISTIARRGSTSAARAVTGGFSDLRAGNNDQDCRSHRIETAIEDDVRVVGAVIPTYKETEAAHEEAADSHMFDARLAHVHEQLADVRDALHRGDFADVFEAAEHDTLSLAATTMTGPEGWVYWQPETLEVFERVRELRADDVAVYFSGDTGASIYVNTTSEYVDRVEDAIGDLGIETMRWHVGGPARVVDADEALF
ncbi:MAG: phosphomevalonate decarboxylase MvaD [Halorhabdus sp.]